jgi:hypothetical protein
LTSRKSSITARYYAENIVTTIRTLIILIKKLCIKQPTHPSTKKNLIQKSKIQKENYFTIQNHQWDDNLMRSLLEKILPEREH